MFGLYGKGVFLYGADISNSLGLQSNEAVHLSDGLVRTQLSSIMKIV